MIQGFFTNLQDKYNVNTVPTVVRLTNKLKRPDIPENDTGTPENAPRKYPFCPLCLGIRDPINNLLEVGSTIKRIEVTKDGNIPFAVESSDEWFKGDLERVMCFGCKRLAISAKDQDKLMKLLPKVVLVNGCRTF